MGYPAAGKGASPDPASCPGIHLSPSATTGQAGEWAEQAMVGLGAMTGSKVLTARVSSRGLTWTVGVNQEAWQMVTA